MIFNQQNREWAIAYMDNLFERKRSVKIELVTESRTLSQNNYMWLVFTHVAYCTGNYKDDLYRLCLNKFGITKEIQFNGLMEQIIVSMSSMTKEQMSAFIDKCVIFFRQEGIDVPDPETKEALEMFNQYKQRGWI